MKNKNIKILIILLTTIVIFVSNGILPLYNNTSKASLTQDDIIVKDNCTFEVTEKDGKTILKCTMQDIKLNSEIQPTYEWKVYDKDNNLINYWTNNIDYCEFDTNDEGYKYTCTVTGVTSKSYNLINNVYNIFLRREVESYDVYERQWSTIVGNDSSLRGGWETYLENCLANLYNNFKNYGDHIKDKNITIDSYINKAPNIKNALKDDNGQVFKFANDVAALAGVMVISPEYCITPNKTSFYKRDKITGNLIKYNNVENNEAARNGNGYLGLEEEYLNYGYRKMNGEMIGSYPIEVEENRKVSTPKQLIYDCYIFLLGREPSNIEMEDWLNVYRKYMNRGIVDTDKELINTDNQGKSWIYARDEEYEYWAVLPIHKSMIEIVNEIASSQECTEYIQKMYSYDGNKFTYTKPGDEYDNKKIKLNYSYEKQKTKFKLTINPNRGIYDGKETKTEIELETNSTTKINTPTREGYKFIEWIVNAPGGSSFNKDTNIFKMGNMNATLTAQWQPNTYQVEYWGNGGNLEGTTNTGIIRNRTYGNEYRIEANPFYRIGYTFTGWNTERNGTGTSYAIGTNINTLTQKLVLYAQWTPNTYKVTYNPNGGTGSNKEENRQYGIAYNIKGNSWARYEKTGYYHNGWNTKSDGTGIHYNAGDDISLLTTNLTLYAQWTPITYTINYDSNKPSRASTSISGNTPSSTHTYDVLKNLTSNGYKLPGYIFQGWNTKADGTGTNYSNEQSVTNLTTVNGATITLYARWTPITYTVEYDRNQSTTGHWNIGTGGTTNPTYHTFDVPSNLATNGFTKNAYQYTGKWNTVWNGSGTSYNDGEERTNLTTENGATIRLYAQWQLITKNIIGQVIWDDFNNTYGLRPENVQVTLNNDTDTVEKVKGADVNPLTVTARANSNNYQFTNTQSKKESNNSDYTYWVAQNDIGRYYTTTIDGFNITNKLNTYEIQGKVFLDSLGGNNQYDIGEQLKEIQVTLYDEYNNQIAITLSQSDGSYKFENLSPAKKYKVKFTYNGLLFENLKYNTIGVNTSKVQENERNIFNSKFKEIGSYPNNYQTIDWNTGAKITNKIFVQEEIVALFKEITSEIVNQNGNEKVAYQNIITKYGNTDEIKNKVQFIRDLRIDAYTDLLNSDSLTLADGKYISNNINCGIKLRKTLDIAINTDIYNAEVQINRKTEQYIYNKEIYNYASGIREREYQQGIRTTYLKGTDFTNRNRTRNIEGDSYNLYLRPEEITNGKLEERILWRQYI